MTFGHPNFFLNSQGGFSSLVKSLRAQCIELLTEIEARLDFEDEMPPLDINLIMEKINSMSEDVENALETANYDKLLQSGLQVIIVSVDGFWFFLQVYHGTCFQYFHPIPFSGSH